MSSKRKRSTFRRRNHKSARPLATPILDVRTTTAVSRFLRSLLPLFKR